MTTQQINRLPSLGVIERNNIWDEDTSFMPETALEEVPAAATSNATDKQGARRLD